MMGRIINTLGLVLVAGLLCSQISQADTLFTDDGYRATRYRSPTPLTHDDAHTLEPAELLSLQQQQPAPLLVDAYGNPWRHGRLPCRQSIVIFPARCGWPTAARAS